MRRWQLTAKAQAIYEREVDLQNAFLKGFLSSNKVFNGETQIYNKSRTLTDMRYQKALSEFMKGCK